MLLKNERKPSEKDLIYMRVRLSFVSFCIFKEKLSSKIKNVVRVDAVVWAKWVERKGFVVGLYECCTSLPRAPMYSKTRAKNGEFKFL